MIRQQLLAASLLTTLAGSAALADSEVPPKGPPWKRDFHEAQREALREGKPIFLYFTKTY